ncbi:MAG: METTL5 family protein [Halobacteria archaeon]|nr:METTL5 family protein [Halobacteria archaeon]
MDRKNLEILLERLEGFSDPEPGREQYSTPPETASHILHTAALNRDLDGVVFDLGCGTGVLGVGSAVLGSRVVGFDVDRDVLRTARRNARDTGVGARTDWVRADVTELPVSDFDGWDVTVVMNPPFGAQKDNEGADRDFLEVASEVADTVYTVHNSGSRGFVESFVDDLGGEVTHAFEAEIGLPRSFEFHDEELREIDVEVYRLVF